MDEKLSAELDWIIDSLPAGLVDASYIPTYIGATAPMDPVAYEYSGATWRADISGYVTMRGTLTFQVDVRPFYHAIDQLHRALSRLRYPPKTPARATTSRRREKLKKAGVI